MSTGLLGVVSGLCTLGFVLAVGTAFRLRHLRLTQLRRASPRLLRARRLLLVGALVTVGGVLLSISPLLVVLLVPGAWMGRFGWRQFAEQRDHRLYERSLPVVLEAVARHMRSGAGLVMALTEVGQQHTGPVSADLRHVVRDVTLGRSLASALSGWSARHDSLGTRLTTSSLALAAETGAAHAEVIDRVAVSVRQHLNARDSARTHATQSRASAWALTLLPLLFTGPMVVVDASVRHFFTTWLGATVLAAGLLLDVLGAWWMSRLIARVSS